MPELPEVETIVRELKSQVIGKEVKKIDEFRQDTVIKEVNVPDAVLGKISDVTRRGKYIILTVQPHLSLQTRKEQGKNCDDSSYDLIIHLRMTGKLILVEEKAALTKHTRAIIWFTDGTKLMFDDIRTFGNIWILKSKERHRILCKLGFEPFSQDFNMRNMAKLLAKRKTTIKNFLLDQRNIAGLGNIYVNEILYACGIPPNKMANTLNDTEIKLLVTNTKHILRLAIQHSGTSISDYRRVDDKTGSFQNFLKIYGKETCHRGHSVRRTKTSGRSTFHCPQCQKEKRYNVTD